MSFAKKENSSKKCISEMGTLWALIVLCIVGVLVSPSFLKGANIINVMRQISINGIIALGMTFVCLTGGVDLSVGSQVAVYGIMIAQMLKNNVNPLIAIPVTLVVALLIGFLNGLGIAKGKLAPFIMTLGSMTALRGLAKYISNGSPQNWRATGIDIKFIGQGYVGFIPVPVIIFLVMFLIGLYILRYTWFGRSVYAIGDNREAARLNGINVEKTQLICFIITAFVSFMSALVLTSKLSSCDPTAGEGYELDALSMCYIGGISTMGGVGKISGTLIGADKIDGGKISLFGKECKFDNIKQALEAGFGIVPEERKVEGLQLNNSLVFNISLPALPLYSNRFGKIIRNLERDAADKYIELFNIRTPGRDANVKNLSGGNQQKVVLGKWIAADCKILLVDEPTRGVDVGSKREIYTILNSLLEQGLSIIMVSSELHELIGTCDRICVMNEGRITGELKKEEFSEETIMRYATM